MKCKFSGLFIFILFLSRVYAHDTISVKPTLLPIGFNTSDHLMLGAISGNTVLYATPDIEINEPPKLLPDMNVNWVELLQSGIKSLLFESKNYGGADLLSSYSVFANGNYSVIDERLLKIANRFLFRNKTTLNKLYNWALPSYQEAFQLLTYEEQEVQQRNLQVAEKYIQLVLANKNIRGYNAWLRKMSIEEDEKVTGFLKRRVMKGQWTIDDCRYWVSRIKKDFMPLMKNKGNPASHYQITEQITNNLFIAVDGKGKFFLLDRQFKALTHPFQYIYRKDDQLIAMRSDSDDDSFIYSISEYNEKGSFNMLPFPEWNTYTPITDSSGIFTARRMSGIYDLKNKRFILDSCQFIRSVAHSQYVIAKKIRNLFIEQEEYESNHHLIYNFNGQKLTDEAVYVKEEIDYSTDETVFTYNVSTSPDGKIIAFVNKDKKAGLIDSSGKLVASFQYEWVDFSEYPHKVHCGFSLQNKMADTILLD